MFTNLKNIVIRFCLLASLAACANPAFAQEAEIEIINQDGEKVDALKLEPAAEVQPRSGGNGTGVKVQQEDDKLIITDANGEKREVNVAGARGVSITQSTQTVMENGKPVTKTVGKAIIVGPDGTTQEIELGDGAEGLAISGMPGGFTNAFKANRVPVNKYMIGVACSTVSKALRAQLQLDSDAGLMVNHVGQNTPAAAAGLQEYDVILFADDRELKTQQDLVEVVQEAGKGNSPLSLTVVRAGKEIGVDVSPVERTADQLRMALPRQMFKFGNFGGDLDDNFNDVEFKQFGPGVILGGDPDQAFANMQQQMQKIQEQMQEMRQRMQQQMQAGE